MYKIVLYSDEKAIFDTITNVFKEYLPALSEMHFKILKFDSTLELNTFNENGGKADIYFLNLSSFT